MDEPKPAGERCPRCGGDARVERDGCRRRLSCRACPWALWLVVSPDADRPNAPPREGHARD